MPEPIVPTPKVDAVETPQAVETKVETPAATPEVKPEATPTVETPKTMEQIREEAVPETKSKDTVGLDKFLEIKKENKELKKSIEDLTKKIEQGATKEEVSADLASISEEYPDVDPKFLNKLASAIKSQVESEVVGPLKAKDREAKIDQVFNEHFDKAMQDMPEFANIVNKDVIKTLSLDPKNSKKTFKQIIEETYGNAVTGKRTIESTVPGGGKDAEPLDFARARKDSAYFDIVMANPKLKKEYNERMLKEGF